MHRHSLTWVAIFAVITLMFLRLPPMAARQDSILNTYGPLVEVDALVKQRFVEPIRDHRLVDGAIRGMMLQLDPYSGYISADELPALKRWTDGEYIGVGIELGIRDGKMTVIAPIAGSPAADAGVLAGDKLLSVNGESIDDHSVFDVMEMLAGPPGTTVLLRVQHRGEDEPTTLSIARGPVHVHTVRGFSRDADEGWDYIIDRDKRIGYVRVSSFRDNTMADFDAALAELTDDAARGLILDLRINPGGLMTQAVEMVDRFVENGPIVATVTRRRAVDEYRAHRDGTVTDLGLVVLIDGASASSAEIVAGALQALGRATLVGSRSFGKGSVQHLIYLKEHEAAIKLTVAYYRLPDGRLIHRTPANEAEDSWGVKPDITVELTDEEIQAIQQSRQALDLLLADPVPEDASTRNAAPRETLRSGSRPTHILLDRQLRAALAVLADPGD